MPPDPFDDLPEARSGADPFGDLPAAGGVKLPERPIAGLVETGLNLGTGLAGMAAGGLTGLVTGDPGAVEPVAEALTYEPRTKTGKAMSEAVQYPFHKLAEFGDWLGEIIREKTAGTIGDEAAVRLATAVNTALQAGVPVGVAKGAGMAVRRAPRVAEPVESAQPAMQEAAPLADRPFPIPSEPAEAPAPQRAARQPKPAPEMDPFADLPNAGNLDDVAAFKSNRVPEKVEPKGYWEGPGGLTDVVETDHVPSMKERAKELVLNDRRWTQIPEKSKEAEFQLERETPEQLRAAETAAERERAKAAVVESAPPPEEFTLAGSERATDQAAARGQMELTAEKPPSIEEAKPAVEAPVEISTPETPIAAAEQPKPLKRASATPTSLLTQIKRMGGISHRELLDLTGENRGIVRPGLFSKSGNPLDDLATRLRDEGFDIPMDMADGGVQALRNMIQDELNGRKKHYSFADQERVSEIERNKYSREMADEERERVSRETALEKESRGETQNLTDEEALSRWGPGTLGMNAALDPALIKQTGKDVAAGARAVMNETMGAPGEHRNLFNPIRNREQHNVARVDRWAAAEGHGIREAFPKPKDREALTMALVNGDFSGFTGQQLAVAQKLKQAYQQMGDYAIEAKRLDGLRQNYSPQIWDMNDTQTRRIIEMWRDARDRGPIREDSPMIREKGGGTFSPFMLERAIENIQEGMRLGLKPASLDAAALFETYARSMGRAVERGKTMSALNTLMSEDGTPMVMPTKQAPRDYVPVRNAELEGLRVHPDIAPTVRVMLETDNPGVIGMMGQMAAYSSKRALVSYSFFHPTALMEAWIGTGGNPLRAKGAIDTALSKYREGGTGDLVDQGLAGGLKLGAPIEDLLGRERFGKVFDKAEKVLDKVGAGGAVRVPRAIDQALQRATWDYIHTGLKIETFLRKYEAQITKNAEAIASGKITKEAIARQAAEFTNSTFGGLNWERMIDKFDTPTGRQIMSELTTKQARRWQQTFLFAPDWLVSTVSSWTNAATGGEAAAIRKSMARRYLATSALWTFTIGNALNYAFTGHSMFENKSGKKDATAADHLKEKMHVQLGDGRRMNLNKHFLEVPHAAVDPIGFAMHKVNPITVAEPLEQIFNKQWLSQGWTPPITEKKDSAQKAFAKRAKHVAGKFAPITGRSIMDQGPAGLGGFLGVPVYGITEEQKRKEKMQRDIDRAMHGVRG